VGTTRTTGFTDAVGRGDGTGVGGDVAAAAGVAVTRTEGSDTGVGEGLAARDGAGDGVADGEGTGDGEADGTGDDDGDGEGDGEGVGASVTTGRGPSCCGTGVTAGTEVAPSSGTVPRFWNADTSAPIPRPATMTPMINAAIGKGPPPVPPALALGGGGCWRRRRGAGSGIASRFPRIRQEALPPHANAPSMIRVRVPIDVNAVLCADSIAFALATPLRVGELLTHAVLDALGPRAPQDKRERMVASTHAGLNDGAFIVEIDGRIYEHCDDVTVVAGVANLRFYRRERRDTAA
jgi:hypothetical protein